MTPSRCTLLACCWFGCVLALAGVSAQLAARSVWLLDQIAVAAPQLTLLAAGLLVIPLAARRWVCLGVSAGAVVLSAAMFIPGRAPAAASGASHPVTILTINALGMNQTPQYVVDMIAQSDAELVTIVECSWGLWSIIQTDDRIHAAYPFGSGPAHPKEWSRVKLSKWPLRPIDLVKDERWDVMKWNYLFRRSHVVEHPDREFIIGAFVVRSPRSARDWRAGNDQLVENCTVIREYLAPLGLPIAIGVDLNATPASSRTDTVRALAGLYRSKPWSTPAGTWPASNPRWARVAIDDILVSSGITVVTWDTVEHDTGSDHVAVRAVLSIPGVQATTHR